MKILTLAFIVFYAAASLAKIDLFKLEIESSVGDEQHSKSKMVLKEGEPFSYTDEAQNMIEVTAVNYNGQIEGAKSSRNIEMNFQISRELGDGTIEILGEPKIITMSGKTAEITIEDPARKKLSLLVKAKKL